DWQFGGNRFSVTYFYEKLASAFRTETNYLPLAYRHYDGNSVDADALNAAPRLEDFTYHEVEEFWGYSKTVNNSTIEKKGIEFQYVSPRTAFLNLRVTFNGAWFHTKYRNT